MGNIVHLVIPHEQWSWIHQGRMRYAPTPNILNFIVFLAKIGVGRIAFALGQSAKAAHGNLELDRFWDNPGN